MITDFIVSMFYNIHMHELYPEPDPVSFTQEYIAIILLLNTSRDTFIRVLRYMGHIINFGSRTFVPYSEVVPISEVPIKQSCIL